MISRIKKLYRGFLNSSFNQYHYISVYVLLSILVASLGIMLDQCAAIDIIAYIQIWGIKLLNGGLFLGSYFGVIYFLRGIKYDVLNEIFVEHNISAGIWLGLLAPALAIVLTINS
jgi:hypothetical protein